MDAIHTILDGLRNAFLEGYAIWWALVLGFVLSGVVQAWVSRGRIEALLGGRGLGATLRATGLGAASSSCSYAAVAIARSAFAKGAGLPGTLAFMFASTNLVFEIGIVLWVFLGPAFTAAEFAGGLILILIIWAAVRLSVSRREEEGVRAIAQSASGGHEHTASGGERSLRERVVSIEAWTDVAENFFGDWKALWKEIFGGFVIAGFVALVPKGIFDAIFVVDAPTPVRTIENVLIGPVIAIVAFVCSVSNIPLAAVLWVRRITFAGVISFIYADLLTLPIIAIYRKYYGARFTLKLVALMFVTIVASGLIVDGLFSALGLVPGTRPSLASITDRGISLDYTAVLNIVFTIVAAVLWWLTIRRRRSGGGEQPAAVAAEPLTSTQAT